MAEEFDPIEQVLDRAMEYASERNHEYVVLEHLLLSLMEEKDIQNLISEIGGETDEIMHDCMDYIENNNVNINKRKSFIKYIPATINTKSKITFKFKTTS